MLDRNQFVAESGTVDSTVRSTNCTFHAQANTNRCVHCNTLYRSTLRKRLDRQKQVTDSKKDQRDVKSKCPLTSLHHDDLLARSRALSALVTLEKKKKSYWYHRYRLVQKEAKLQMPKSFMRSLTSHHFETLISEAIKVGELTEKSILYYILLDTLSKLRNKPTAIRYSQAVIKWCVSLSNKIHRRGYEALREAVPLPCWTTLQSYRFNSRSSNPICEENITQFKNVLEVSGCKGVGGIHWDEIYVKKGVFVCKRTKELVGFEDLDLPKELLVNSEQVNGDNVETDSEGESDDSDSGSDEEGISSKGEPVANKIVQFFWSSLEGDVCYPVASFPVRKLTTVKITMMIWKVIRRLCDIEYGSGRHIRTLYGLCDGASYSSAFFERPTQQTWMTNNPFSKHQDPIFWISDPPHMIKKLRNFIVSPTRDLRFKNRKITAQHILDMLETGVTNLSIKHLNLDKRTKMNVKLAAQLMSHHVALNLLQHPSLPVQQVYYTAMYIYHTANYFDIMNSITLEKDYMPKLLRFLTFILKWKEEIDADSREAYVKNANFITKHTYKDLTRSIRGFIHLIQYIKENMPSLEIVPRTISQDDVENYFSLQRSRKAGGDITVADYLAGNKALSTHFMLHTKDVTANAEEVGNYSKVNLTPHSSIVLRRRKLYRKSVCGQEPEDWKVTDVNMKDIPHPMSSYPFIHARDKRQIFEQFMQTLSNLRLPRAHLTMKMEIVSKLKLNKNRSHVQKYLQATDYCLRNSQFNGPWHKDKYKEFLQSAKKCIELRHHWNELMKYIGVENSDDEHTSLLGQIMKTFGRYRCVTYLKKQGFGYDANECAATRQKLKYNGSSSLCSMKRSHDGKVRISGSCFNCGDPEHFIRDCPLPKQANYQRNTTVS